MDFELLIFDLDNTLLRTDGLANFRGAQFIEQIPPGYREQLQTQARALVTAIYPEAFLLNLRQTFPALRFGIFTRAPRAYVDVLLGTFYPGFAFDAVVAAREAAHPKPAPDAIINIAQAVNVLDATKIAVIGDDKVDLQAAYRAGVWMVSEESAWTTPLHWDHYALIERMPDARIKGPRDLLAFLNAPADSLPLMERWSWIHSAPPVGTPPRIETINHFDRTEDGRAAVRINVLGRRFRDDEEDKYRRAWHPLSNDIEGLKDAEQFPDYWIGAIRGALEDKGRFAKGNHAIVTVIPAKPGRQPRLERLLSQLEASHRLQPIRPRQRQTLSFRPDVFAYTAGVRSHHGEFLSAVERFVNIRDHFQVVDSASVVGRSFIVLDDVTTTGATLFYAWHYLMDNGASSVIPISFAKAVSAQ